MNSPEPLIRLAEALARLVVRREFAAAKQREAEAYDRRHAVAVEKRSIEQ